MWRISSNPYPHGERRFKALKSKNLKILFKNKNPEANSSMSGAVNAFQ
jgi:hypothetical protein